MDYKKDNDPVIGLYKMGKASNAKRRSKKISMMVEAKLMADQIEDMLPSMNKKKQFLFCLVLNWEGDLPFFLPKTRIMLRLNIPVLTLC